MNLKNIKILLTEKQIQQKVKELAKKISNDYKNKTPLLIGILKGSFIFLSDLVRYLTIGCEVDFIAISSYEGFQSTGVVRQLLDLRHTPENKDVLLVEDIVDTGLTLQYLIDNLKTRNPKSLKVCVLFDKPDCHKVPVKFDYLGFVLPNKYVVGYGLDYNERYRNLSYLGVIV